MARGVQALAVVWVIVCLLVPVRAASADPVTVGTLTMGAHASGSGSFTNGGAQVSVSGFGFVDTATVCSPCVPGTTLSLTASLSDLDGFVSIISPAFRLPDATPEAAVPWMITMPFVLEASYHPVTGAGPTGSFVGSGLVTATFETWTHGPSGPLFAFAGAEYVAGAEAPVPTPEPGTLVLLGTALSGAYLRFRCRRRET